MATIEERYLPPLNPAVTIAEADRQKIHDVIGKHVADILTGPQSYYPEGIPKDTETLASGLEDFIRSLKEMQQQADDPSNVLGTAIGHLKEHAKSFRGLMKANEPVDNIELPPELSPMTRDNNTIYVDPEPGPYSPPNPVSPKRQPLQRGVSFESSIEQAEAALSPEINSDSQRLQMRSVSRALPVADPLSRGQAPFNDVLAILADKPTLRRPSLPPIFGSRR